MQYRPEIDGLRALAVVPVMFFHAGFEQFSGGFVGVDVFFVISGYLITTILLDEHRRGCFSIWRFYERRVRRILPALYLVMLTCIVFAWGLMLPDDLENFGQSLVATALFANNVLLCITSNYFQMETDFKPLLHTWSLAVEEQFYVVFPVLLTVCWRSGQRNLFVVFIAIGLLSLGLAEWGWRIEPEGNYYLITSRAWELMAGALAALYLFERPKPSPGSNVGAVVGLLLISLSVIWFDQEVPFPSLWALMPILGTVLVVLFARPGNLVGRCLAWRPIVVIGLISYSLYLWHQPILAFMRITRLQVPTPAEVWACLIATVFMAWLSWRYVETPFRQRDVISVRTLCVLAAGISTLLIAVGMHLHFSSGRAHNWPELLDERGRVEIGIGLNAAYNRRPDQYQGKDFPENGLRNVLVLGDSFARDFINAGLENDYFVDANLLYVYGRGICAFDQPPDGGLSRVLQDADTIVFAGSLSEDSALCVDSAAITLTHMSKRAVVIGSKNFGWNNNAIMLLPEPDRYQFRTQPLDRVERVNSAMATALSEHPSIEFVDIVGLLADGEGRVPVFTPNRKLISQDREHFTRWGARFVGQIMLSHPVIKALSAPP